MMVIASELSRAIEKIVDINGSVKIQNSQRLSGGCINDAWIVEVTDGRKFFVKSNQQTRGLFKAETEGLEALRLVGSIRIPRVVGLGVTENETEFLVLEAIEIGNRKPDFMLNLGRSLAKFHQNSVHSKFGFHLDNFIGESSQPNSWSTNWIEFWGECRIRHQLKLAVDKGFSSGVFKAGCETLIAKLEDVLGVDEPPVLVHGDLWSGNLLTSSDGEPVLIDPAAYYGSRESEFGMTTLFGGFNSDFYVAYNEVWPLQDDWRQRVEIYQLYHLMNHLNLFGSSYLDACQVILNKYR